MGTNSKIFLVWLLVAYPISCVTEFIPGIREEEELLVVEGLLTDQPGINTIRLSTSLPAGRKADARPLGGCNVELSDDVGNTIVLYETKPGTYVTDSATFQGVIGRTYILQIATGNKSRHYNSSPMEMIAVPPIDSLYYVKTIIDPSYENHPGIEGCQICLDTRDPLNICEYFRWDYTETWVLRLLFPVDNMKCWISDTSENISIKNTAALDEPVIVKRPVTFITNETGRLNTKYSIKVNQYSLSEEEYIFWEKLQNISEQVGGLYDIIPSSIPGNMRCMEHPDEKVLGYFSVSARSSKRIFIDEDFAGSIDIYEEKYRECVTQIIYGDEDPPDLYIHLWTLIDHPFPAPRVRYLTNNKGCADCTVFGTTSKPDFWVGD